MCLSGTWPGTVAAGLFVCHLQVTGLYSQRGQGHLSFSALTPAPGEGRAQSSADPKLSYSEGPMTQTHSLALGEEESEARKGHRVEWGPRVLQPGSERAWPTALPAPLLLP